MKNIASARVLAFGIACSFLLLAGPGREIPAFAASGASGLAPLNYNFDSGDTAYGGPQNSDFEDSGQDVGTPPTNHNFISGFNSWTKTGTGVVESGGPSSSGKYAKLGNGGSGSGTITSSAFTVDSNAQIMSLQRAFLGTGGTNTLFVWVLSGATFGTQTNVVNSSCSCTTAWERIDFAIDPSWRGTQIKLKIQGFRYVGVTDVGTSRIELSGWTLDSGMVARKIGDPFFPDHHYAELQTGQAQITTTFGIQLNAAAQSMSLWSKFFTFSSAGNILDVYVIPAGGQPVKVFTRTCYCTTGWERHVIDITDWANQVIRVRVTRWTGSDGPIGVDLVGQTYNDLAQWQVVEGLTAREGGSPSDGFAKLYAGNTTIVSSAFIPTAISLTFQYKFFNTGTNGNLLTVTALTGPSFNQETQVTQIPCQCLTNWTKRRVPLDTTMVGQPIKLKFVRWSGSVGPIGVDDVGANLFEGFLGTNNKSGDTKDPVDTATGNFHHSNTDLLIPTRGIPLEFTRSYNSASTYQGSLGHRWTHNYAFELAIEDDGSVEIRYPDGHTTYFKVNGSTYTPPAGVFDTLVKNQGDTYTLTTVNILKYSFSPTGKLTSIVDRNGNTISLSYTNGLLTTVEEVIPGGVGRTLTFVYDTSNRIFRITDPLLRTVEFTYDSNGDLGTVKDVKAAVNGPFTTYTYDNHRMTSVTDSNGHITVQNTYDTASRVLEQLDGALPQPGITCIYYGNATSTNANCTGVSPPPPVGQTIVVDPRSKRMTYDFNVNFHTTDVTDDLGGVVHYDFDPNGNVSCIRDQRGNKTGYSQYDSKGNVTEIIDAANTDPNSLTCQLKPLGKVWTFEYTVNNDIKKEKAPAVSPETGRRETEYVYDSDTTGNLTRIVRRDANGLIKALKCFERDTHGQVIATVESTNLELPEIPTGSCTGNRTLFDYDAYGNQICVVNPRFSNTTTCSSPLGPKKTSIYDLGGRILFETDELTNETRPVVAQSPESAPQCGNDFDDDGDGTADDGCTSTANTYDPQNNILTTSNDLGNTTTNFYDAKGLLRVVTDANGRANIYNYNTQDQLIESREGGGYPTTYTYDADGNRTSVTNPNRLTAGGSELFILGACGASGTGNGINDDPWSDALADDGCPSTVYMYDDLNRLQSTADAPPAGVTSYEYDPASNLKKRTDARGIITNYRSDSLDRRDCVWVGAATPECPPGTSETYRFDELGNRTEMVDSSGITLYQYDALSRLSSATFPGPKMVSYLYDTPASGGLPAQYPGQRTRITYPDLKTVDYTYEKDGRMKSVTDWLSKQTVYDYDDAGRLATALYPNNTCTAYGYDAADRLQSVFNRTTSAPQVCSFIDPVISSYTYTLNGIGNRTQVEGTSGTHTYGYRTYGPYWLTQETGPDYQYSYDYDENGNRLVKNGNPAGYTGYSYNAANQMVSAGAVSHGYDPNGNLTSRGVTDTFDYDRENRLTQTVMGGVTSTSVYNGDGLRMSHTVVGGATTSYTWDVSAGSPVVLQDSTTTYVYGIDLISSTDVSSVQSYFLYDGLGSTTNLTDSAGSILATYTYDAFGVSPPGGSNPWLFTGEQRDVESNFYYLRARYYDPAVGRFLTQDPLRTGHPYAYVRNNPVNLRDPYGLIDCGTFRVGKLCDKATDAIECVGNGFDCVAEAICGKEGGFGCVADFLAKFATSECINFAAQASLAGVGLATGPEGALLTRIASSYIASIMIAGDVTQDKADSARIRLAKDAAEWDTFFLATLNDPTVSQFANGFGTTFGLTPVVFSLAECLGSL